MYRLIKLAENYIENDLTFTPEIWTALVFIVQLIYENLFIPH